MNRHQSEIANWMSSNPVTIVSNRTLLDAYNLMGEHGVRRLPVVDSTGELSGIITLSDIQKTVPVANMTENVDIESVLSIYTVGRVMTSAPVTVESDDTIQDAAEAMLEYQVSGLPVVQGHKVVGIITESDIFRLVVESWSAVMA